VTDKTQIGKDIFATPLSKTVMIEIDGHRFFVPKGSSEECKNWVMQNYASYHKCEGEVRGGN
jgi:hypothetical protein